MANGRACQALIVLMTATVLAGCGQPAPPPRATTDPPDRWADGVGRVASAADADVAGTMAGLWAFADRFGATTARKGENAVFSPASMGYAFAMLRAGAGGETAEQLDEVFGFPASVHDAFTVLRRDVVTTDKPPTGSEPVVAIANGLFVKQGRTLRADYVRLIREKYGAAAQYVDFTSGEATKVINAWVREQTADRIDKLFDRIEENTLAVLANAVYLKAGWATPFDESQTKDEPFQLADGGTVNAPMMRFAKPDKLNHVSGDGWQAVELPYKGGELSMWVLLPTKGLTPPRLAADTLSALGDAEPKIVDLTLPRWEFGQKIDLLPELKKLGLTALSDLPAFSPHAFVGQAIHRANITVDESGTEAAAVTGIAVEESAGPQPDVTVRADRPFTFAIVHKPTGAPMFLGTVADPTAG